MSIDMSAGGYRKQLEAFIKSYKNEPCLWQLKSKHYHNRSMKDAAYNRIIKSYEAIDPNATRDIVVKKINNLRTAYKKEVKKLQNAILENEEYTPRLWYFHLFNFLDEQEPVEQVTIPTPLIIKEELEDDETSHELPQQSTGIEEQNWNEKCTSPDTPNKSIKQSRPIRRIKYRCVNNSIKHFRSIDDRFDVFGKNVAIKLRDLPLEQRLFAEKLINETLFLAEINFLTMAHNVCKK